MGINREFGYIGKNISLLYRRRQTYLNSKLDEFGIGCSEYMFIMSMPMEGSVTLSYLAQDVAVDPALATKAVNKLVEKGIFLKVKSKEDKRAFNVSLTEKGKDIKPKITKILHGWIDSVTEGMDKNIVDDISMKLEMMVRNIPKE